MGKRLTSGYTFVVHEVSSTTATLWLGALSPSMGKPRNWKLVVKRANTEAQRANETGTEVFSQQYGDEWKRPFAKLNKRFYTMKTLENLSQNTYYIVEFQIRSEHEWRVAEKAFFTTLPNKLPSPDKKPFIVGIGSCFYTEHDGGSMGQAYEALYRDEKMRPDIKFLLGDQIYADIGLGWYPLDESDCQERIADHYVDSWKYLRSILRRGGTWMISDDHEFWNDYPFFDGFNPYLIVLKIHDTFRKYWEAAAHIGVKNIQQIQKTIRTFNIGNDLSFCVADLRVERTELGFLSNESQAELLGWVTHLNCPGVLVIPQPLIMGKGEKDDKALPEWDQYKALLKTIELGNHDIVVLTGDVHYGRVAEVLVGGGGNKLVEVITSPMSNLSEINCIAASTPNTGDKNFPVIPIDGMKQNKIKYLATVTTEGRWFSIRYPKTRTHEHFMTVAFSKSDQGVQMKVNAWHARIVVKNSGLPKKITGFNPAVIKLK